MKIEKYQVITLLNDVLFIVLAAFVSYEIYKANIAIIIKITAAIPALLIVGWVSHHYIPYVTTSIVDFAFDRLQNSAYSRRKKNRKD